MTDEEKIAFIKLRIGDVPSNPLYPMFSDEEYEMALLASKGNVDRAVRMMAITAVMLAGSVSSREHIDDFDIQNDFSKNYLAALQYLINDPVSLIPDNLIPWIHTKCGSSKLMDVADLSCCGQNKIAWQRFSTVNCPDSKCNC